MLQGSKTIGRLFKYRLQQSPDNYAIGWIENNEVKNLKFSEYKNTLEVLAAALKGIGVNIGDKVSLLAQTCKEWHLLDMATMLSRSCLVPIYPNYLTDEIKYIFNHSESNVLIVENDKQMEKVVPILTELKNLKVIISIQDLSEDILKKFRNSVLYYSYIELLRLGKDEIKSNPDLLEIHIQNQQPEEYASIIYTSGTTGEPKGAVITQHALTSMLLNLETATKGSFGPKDKTLVFLPLSHVLGRCDSLLPLVFGWQSVYAESLENLLDNLSVVKPTIMIAVPRIFEKIYSKVMEQINRGSVFEKKAFSWAMTAAEKYFFKVDQDLSPSAIDIIEYNLATKLVFSKIYSRFGGKIRYFVTGGAPLSIEIINFLRYANLTILEGYGLTESLGPSCLNPLTRQVPGTVGRPIGDVQIKFGPDHEIMIKSDALMKEYYKNPEATSESLCNGWFLTGDIGEFTPEGYLKITDRKKDIIITNGGKNVAPQKIENMAKVQQHISHMVVIGDKRNYLTAIIGIEKERFLPILDDLNLSFDCTLSDLAKSPKVREIIQSEIESINLQLAQFENIKDFIILGEEFTTDNYLTPSLKVKRKVVIERLATEIDALYSDGHL